jgi:ABC-2 type transport system ATP-binding protein
VPGVIEAIDLTVRRRGRTVIDAVSFDVHPGQVTGVLGGTGAGKTTLLRRMVDFERGGGKTLFNGLPYRALRFPMREVGLLLRPGAGHPDRTVRSQLRLALAADRRFPRPVDTSAATSGDDESTIRLADGAGHGSRATPANRIDVALETVGLSDHGRTRLCELTGGIAARLGIAIALLGDPKALVLDCPQRDLEPEGIAWLGAFLRAFTGQQRSALVTGSETETLVELADRILLLDHGQLVGERTAEDVLLAPAGAAVVVRSPQIVRFAAILAEAGARNSQGDGACLEVRGFDRARVGDLAYQHGIPVHELSERFTGSDRADLVLAACSRRDKPIVPLRGRAWTGASDRLAVSGAAEATDSATLLQNAPRTTHGRSLDVGVNQNTPTAAERAVQQEKSTDAAMDGARAAESIGIESARSGISELGSAEAGSAEQCR